jgi:membrane protein involved in colicin uptake
MAEPLTNDRVSVNYFAHGGASGAPTVAYEFEVDLAAKTVAGRNPAAKAVIAGKAAAPPAPPKAKRIKLRPKAKGAKAKPKADLDSLLGAAPAPAGAPEEEAAPKAAKPPTAKRAAKASGKTAPAENGEKAADETLLDDILKE